MTKPDNGLLLDRRILLTGGLAGLGGLLLGGCASVDASKRNGTLAATPARPGAGARIASNHTLSVGPAHTTDWAHTDTNASIDQDAEGNTWMILGVLEWSIYKGTSMDNMVLQHTYKPDFVQPHGDDWYWSSGLWIDRSDGKWYCAVHCEYNYGRYTGVPPSKKNGWSNDHRRRMVLVTSTDQGKSWAMVGDILTGAHPEEPAHYGGDYFDKGAGDAHIFIDDNYFYAFYRTGWYQKSTGRFFEAIRAARCPKAERMRPGAWRKWYRGAWNEPGLGGHDTDVFNSHSADTAYVFHSTALRQYVALIGAGDIDAPEGYFATCSDLGAQDWSDPIRFADTATHQWYNWAVDEKTQSRHVIDGNSFRYYTSRNSAPVWREATFVDAPTRVIVQDPLYPPDSVDDGNPGWER